MQGRSGTRRCIALMLAVSSTACYSYVPLEQGVRPDSGDEVRVYLREEGEATGGDQDRSRELDGLVVESRPDSLVLSIRLAPAQTGTFDAGQRQSTQIAYARIQRIERPELDGLRTGLFIAGGAAVLAGFMAIVLGATDSGVPGDGGGNGPNLQIRIP